MKKIILSAAVAFTVLTTTNVVAQQGFGTNTPDRSAAVDIVSSKRGLLIPRIAISDLDLAAPVANPANALMVYNTGAAGTAAGFYYWDASFDHGNNKTGRWVRFVSSNSGSAVTVSAGTNVTVKPTTDGHDTDYNVSVKGGAEAGQVLVTEIVEVNGENVHSTKWVNPQDFINGSVVGENGITTEIKTVDGKEVVTVGLGGDLDKATEIVTAADKTLAIKGLVDVSSQLGIGDGKIGTPNIVVMGADGILKVVTPKALIEDSIKGGNIDGKALTSSSISVDTNGATALLKDVNIEITPGGTDGMVLVTKVTTETDGTTTSTTEWKAPSALSNTLDAGQGISIDAGNKINLGGNPITSATVLNIEDTNASLAIKGLEEKDNTPGKEVVGNNVVLADSNGVLSETSPANLVGQAIEDGGIEAKTLKGDGITVTAGGAVGTDLAVESALLKDVTLGIADNAITTSKIADGAVSQEKLYAGTIAADGTKTPAAAGNIPVANADGTVTYKPLNTAVGSANLTTDNKIVIASGNDSNLNILTDAVLVPTHLSIKEGSITTVEIADGTIANVDLGSKVVSADKMTSNTTNNGTDTPAGAGQIPVADGQGGVTYQQVTGELLNGKALTSPTGSISVSGSGAKALLDATTIDIKGGDADGQVLVTEKVGDVSVTKWVTPTALGNTVTASNGLTKTDNDIALGGRITANTVLDIAAATTGENATPAGSLSIKGLNSPSDKTEVVKNVVVGADGKMYAVTHADKTGSITINQGGDVNITNNNAYSQNQEEVVIEVTLGNADTNLILPTPTGVEGQTISVKIANENENHTGDLNIKFESGANDILVYGAMPYQGWIIKSNGTKWIVVGRN